MVNVGLIGFGLSGRYFHAPFIKVNPRLNLAKVLTSKPESVKAFDAGIEVVNHADSILNDPKINLIFVRFSVRSFYSQQQELYLVCFEEYTTRN